MAHSWFDPFILLMICFSTVLLTLESPLQDPNGRTMQVLHSIDTSVTAIFVLEMALKVVVMGFVANGRNSYLRNAWNVIDFAIVVFSLISIFASGVDLNFIKALRMVRVLRPLRMISRNEGLKVAVLSIFNAIPGIVNVLVIAGLFFLLFGIFGTTYFKGRFYHCDMTNVLEK